MYFVFLFVFLLSVLWYLHRYLLCLLSVRLLSFLFFFFFFFFLCVVFFILYCFSNTYIIFSDISCTFCYPKKNLVCQLLRMLIDLCFFFNFCFLCGVWNQDIYAYLAKENNNNKQKKRRESKEKNQRIINDICLHLISIVVYLHCFFVFFIFLVLFYCLVFGFFS